MKRLLASNCLALLFQAVALGQMASSTSLLASPSPSNYGQPVTLTATVNAGATGKVTFYDGVTILGIGSISSGQANISTVMLASGKRNLRAYYQGNGTYAASGSAVVAQTVVAGESLGLKPPLSFQTTHKSSAAAAGDFNGDSRQDLAIASYEDNAVTVYLGNGDGTFQPGVDYAAGMGPRSVAVGDFNGDGRIDLAVGDYNGAGISILLGTGDGTFQSAVVHPLLQSPLTVAVADFNGDGNADLVALAANGEVIVLLGKGDGTFQNAAYYPVFGYYLTYTSALAIADFNGDGNADLAATTPEALYTLLGNGDGTFQAAKSVSGTSGGSGVIAMDLNTDGRADLLVYGGDYDSYVLLANGDGTFVVSSFSSAAPPPRQALPANAIIADFNGDGKPDLALVFYLCCTPISSLVQLLPGNGDGTFGSPVNYPLSAGFNIGLVGDFNGDGIADLMLASQDDTGFSVMLGGALPDLTISAAHGIGFTQGQQAATYTVTVSNSGTYGSSGEVDVAASLPSGMTANAIGGSGWNCVLSTLTCSRTDSLAVGASYPYITVQVNFANGLNGYVTSTFTVSGGGETNVSNDAFTDTTFMRYPTATSLTASPNPSVMSQPVTLTASVTAGVTGHVDFYDGALPIGSAPVSNGQSTFTTSSFVSGTRSLRASYSGDSTYGPSESIAWMENVNPASANGAQPYMSYPVDIAPAWIVAADLNGDGKTDIVTANGSGRNTGGSISVLLNTGSGTFRPAVNYDVGSLYPNAAVIADFNNDGKPDVIVAGSNGISFLPGNGDGTFGAAQTFASSTSISALACADFNGDGNLDLVTLSSGTVMLFLGNGDGTFQLPVALTAAGITFSSLQVADMNGDGKPDLVALNQSTLQLSVFLGNGDGTLQAPKTASIVSNQIMGYGAMAVGDFTGDGRLDVAFVCKPAVEVLPGNGDGTFGIPIVTSVDTNPASFAIAADFNGDGNLDIAFSANPFDDTVDFVFGSGAGTFQSGPSFVTGSFNNPGVTTIAVGDFNGDGRLDFAVTSNQLSSVYVFLAGQFPGIAVSSSHTGTFTAGKTGSYSITLSTNTFAGVTGQVTVTDILPPGLTATAISGNNWNCVLATVTCTSGLSLGTGANASPITLTVSVAPNMATGTVNNQVKVTYNSGLYTATDPTTIVAPTTTTLTASPSPVTLGQPVAVTATLTAGATGSVLFLDNGVPIGSAMAVNSVATLNTRLLPSGQQSLTAVYAGDSDHGPSTSPAMFETIQASPSNGFQLPVTYPTAAGPTGIAIGDFNSDGKPDLVTVNASTVSVLLGNGDGTFAPKSDYPVAEGAQFLVVADFNNDGVPDLAVATANGVSVLLGKGDGGFLSAIHTTVGILNFLAVSDFNADGKADLIAFGQAGAVLLPGNGDGTFQPYSGLGNLAGVCGLGG